MISATDAPGHQGLPNPQRLLAFLTLAMAVAMSVLDGSIVNVALPTMAHDLAIAPAASIWIVNAFLLAVTVSLLPLSALGDTIGYRRVYSPGLALFTVRLARLRACPSLAALTVARAVSGPGRSRDHERQHRARPIHLSVVEARSGRRQRRGRGRRLFGRQARQSPPRFFPSRHGDGCS